MNKKSTKIIAIVIVIALVAAPVLSLLMSIGA